MRTLLRYSCFSILLGLLAVPLVANAAVEQQGSGNHKKIHGLVTNKAGVLAVKTPEGATYQLNPKAEARHGHDTIKEGDEVVIVVDENNLVIDIHPKGEDPRHQMVTGKLLEIGKTNNEVRVETSRGEEVYPLEKMEIKAGTIPEGTKVTLELNEAGSVIDIHRVDKAH